MGQLLVLKHLRTNFVKFVYQHRMEMQIRVQHFVKVDQELYHLPTTRRLNHLPTTRHYNYLSTTRRLNHLPTTTRRLNHLPTTTRLYFDEIESEEDNYVNNVGFQTPKNKHCEICLSTPYGNANTCAPFCKGGFDDIESEEDNYVNNVGFQTPKNKHCEICLSTPY